MRYRQLVEFDAGKPYLFIECLLYVIWRLPGGEIIGAVVNREQRSIFGYRKQACLRGVTLSPSMCYSGKTSSVTYSVLW